MAKPGDKVGDFTLERRIAQSGMGSVWAASGENQGRIALKFAKESPEGSKGKIFSNLIRAEAEALNSLRHPGIVRIFPISASDGRRMEYYARAALLDSQPWYFAMEFLNGRTLRDEMENVMQMPFEWRIELFYQLLVIVEYIHNSGFAHLDLKPENIFFRTPPHQNQMPNIVLIDFGTVSNRDVLDTDAAGTTAYTPAEMLIVIHGIASAETVALCPEKVDVWSLGVLFFELMTGNKLIPHRNENEARTSVLNRQIRAIREVTRGLPNIDRLDNFLSMMLSKNPADRPPVGEIIQAIEEKIAPPPRIKLR